MAGLSGLTRSKEWWSYKIPPLLALAYAMLLTLNQPLSFASLLLPTAGIISIIAVAAYGYVINDCFDIEVDRRAGKSNSMAALAVWQRLFILLIILAIGWTPAVLVPYTPLSSLLLAIDFLLPSIYSIPPIRLKERGVLGILSDAFAAHLVPTLFLSSVVILPTLDGWAWFHYGFIVVAAAWYLFVGLRGIISHQILDREADITSGVVTLATTQDMIRLLRWDRRFLYVGEMIAFVTLVSLLATRTYLLLPAFFIFLFLESLMRVMKWGYFVERTPLQGKRLYLPFANNLFYSLWMPLILAMELALRSSPLVIVPILHFLIFSRGRGREHREPIEALRDTAHELRRFRYRQRFGWNVIVARNKWPDCELVKETLPALRVRPPGRLPNPWDLRLHSARYPLTKGASYQLQVVLRAESPRVVTLGVCQRHSPWRDLGFADVIPVATRWEQFYFDFTATQTEANGGIFLWLGGHEAGIEIGEARLVSVTDPGPWKLVLTKPSQAWRSEPNDASYLVRIDRIKTSGVAWHVKLTSRPFRVSKGKLYRVNVSIRSEASRRLTFGVSQAYPPFDVAGLCEEVLIPEMFEDFQGDFVAERDEDLNVFFWLGADSSMIEILRVDCRQIELPQRWHLDRKEGSLAWFVSTDDPDRVLVDVQKEWPNADAICLWTPLSLTEGSDWACRFRIQSIREPRLLTVGIAEEIPDGWKALRMQKIDTSKTAGMQECAFVAPRSDRPVRFFAWIGDRSDLLMLTDFEVTPVGPIGVWRLEHEAETHGTLTRIDEETLRVIPSGAVGPPFALRLHGSFQKIESPTVRATWTLRADAHRPVELAFERHQRDDNNTNPPLVGRLSVSLTPQWKEYCVDLVQDDTDQTDVYVPTIRAGESGVPVEWQAIRYQAIERGASWSLQASEGSQAYFVPTLHPLAVGRIEIRSVPESPASLQISQPFEGWVSGRCRLDVDLRSDRPRTVFVGVGEGADPWRPVVSPRPFELSTEWSRVVFFIDMEAVQSAGLVAPRLFIWLGGDSSAVEWRCTHVHSMQASEPVFSLSSASPAQIHWAIPANDQLVAVRGAFASSPFQASAFCTLTAIHAIEQYRVCLTLRGSEPRPVTIALNESDTWESVGLYRAIEITPETRTYALDFVASKNDVAPRLVCAIGGNDAAVEIGAVSLIPIGESPIPTVRTGGEKVTTIALDDDPRATRYLLPPTADPWEIKLASRSVSLQAGQSYQLKASLSADAPRSVLVGVGQSNPPWKMYLPPRPVRVDSRRRDLVFDFVAEEDDAHVEGLVCLGGESTAVVVHDLALTPSSRFPQWTLDAADGKGVRVASSTADEEAFEVIEASPEAWRVKLRSSPRPIEPGSVHHFRLRLSATSSRSVFVGLAQDHAPWEGLGLYEKVSLKSEPTEWTASFAPDRSDSAAVFCIWCGDAVGGLTVHGFDWQVERTTPSAEQEPTGNGEINGEPDNIHHAGDEGTAAVGGIDTGPQEE